MLHLGSNQPSILQQVEVSLSYLRHRKKSVKIEFLGKKIVLKCASALADAALGVERHCKNGLKKSCTLGAPTDSGTSEILDFVFFPHRY